LPAALSDFGPVPSKGKVPSEKDELKLELRALPKVLPLLKRKGVKIVGFKAESGVGNVKLAKKATDRCRQSGADAMVANDLKDVRAGCTKVMFIRGEKVVPIEGSKSKVANEILNLSRCML
jgi:phosphopantothenoylcysteine decarboxylase/phosphopantothenate--cysteine ligase